MCVGELMQRQTQRRCKQQRQVVPLAAFELVLPYVKRLFLWFVGRSLRAHSFHRQRMRLLCLHLHKVDVIERANLCPIMCKPSRRWRKRQGSFSKANPARHRHAPMTESWQIRQDNPDFAQDRNQKSASSQQQGHAIHKLLTMRVQRLQKAF